MEEEFKELEIQNDSIRNKIREHLNQWLMSEDMDDTFILINNLIDNEIEQEKYCNQ
ncbi:MAG: hypothetical protein HQ538_06365 [Parcubacteria group bacterium]|nr:hypothetical protein [Parcubacteria group bacterium]